MKKNMVLAVLVIMGVFGCHAAQKTSVSVVGRASEEEGLRSALSRLQRIQAHKRQLPSSLLALHEETYAAEVAIDSFQSKLPYDRFKEIVREFNKANLVGFSKL